MSESSVEKPEILIVDDSKVIRLAAKKMLGPDYEIHLAEDGLIGWEMIQQNAAISVVFTDLSMPNLGGIELLEFIRNSDNEQIANLPVIILTGNEDTDSNKQEVFDAGATDFIGKPFDSIDLLSRAQSYAHLSRKVAELEKKSGYDGLTGLYNENSLLQQGSKSFAFASRHKLFISAIYFEIADFQDYFLTHGKNVAQHIIIAVGKRLQEVMREEDVAARIGVAKYALILPMTNKQKTKLVIERVCKSINRLVFDTGAERIRVSFSAGYTAPDNIEGIEFKDLLAQADDALQTALLSSEQIICFDQVTEVEAEPVVITEQDIEQALAHIVNGDYYQVPQQHLQAVVNRLSPFMHYADNQLTAEPAEGSADKKIAI